MSSIVSAITGSGTPKAAEIQNYTNPAQAQQQYGQMQQGIDAQQQFMQALQAQNGLQNQSNVFNQMQGVANGTGPNPAQAMLANSTGANVANQNAMMAGQRGSAANVGMMARQAANQGANIQQQAAGQGAAMQAQQSLGALGQMGGMANQQAAQLQQGTNAYGNATQQGYNSVTGNINQQNNASIQNQAQLNQANQSQNQAALNMFGNVVGAGGAAMMMPGGGAAAALGGGGKPQQMTMGFAEGGQVPQEQPKGPRSMYGKHCMAQGGSVPAMVSPGEKYLTPAQASQVVSGKADAMSTGKTIPGTPKVGGAKNSYANDTVPMTLQEGGIVIPRDVTQANDAEAKAMAFVKAHFAQQKHGNKKAK